jgi:hypothetical protein
MAKFRSKVDYAGIYAGDKQGYALGIDGAVFLKLESSPRTFAPPAIGTQGSSTSAAAPSTDISGGTDTTFRIVVDGGTLVTVVLVVAGLNTGALIAAALETKINDALLAAGQDARVWCEFAGGLYVIRSQSTGTTSAVVVTDGLTNNVADDLKIGIANSGVEAVGTNDADHLLYTSGGPTYSQSIESNAHRSGRYHSGVVKAKKMLEWTLGTYVNMAGTAGDSLDDPVKLLWKSLLGTEEVTASTRIRYTQGQPNTYFSMVRVGTIFGEYITGCYVKDMTLTFPGDGPATCEWSGKGSKRYIAGIAQTNGVITASASAILNAGQAKRFDAFSRVMAVSPDGRTIVAGQAGDLIVNAVDLNTHTLTLSAAITLADDGYIVPWHPGAVQQSGTDAIYTDLEGTFKFSQSSSAVCLTNISLGFVNDHTDRDNCFGSDANDGYIAGNRLSMTLSATFDLNSTENFAEVVQSAAFLGTDPEIVLGNASSGRYLRLRAPKWIPAVPPIEVPENGPVPVTMEGILYQSVPGARDPIQVDFL